MYKHISAHTAMTIDRYLKKKSNLGVCRTLTSSLNNPRHGSTNSTKKGMLQMGRPDLTHLILIRAGNPTRVQKGVPGEPTTGVGNGDGLVGPDRFRQESTARGGNRVKNILRLRRVDCGGGGVLWGSRGNVGERLDGVVVVLGLLGRWWGSGVSLWWWWGGGGGAGSGGGGGRIGHGGGGGILFLFFFGRGCF